MALSNYPDGVTGNEWQIAGMPETSEWVECEDGDCAFDGEADGYVDGADFVWDCPDCGRGHVEDEFYMPDPDEARDARMEWD